MSGQPWAKWYFSDWRSDPALRMCSLAARGLWMDMLSIMHEADPCGSLVVNGRSLSIKQLAAIAGTSPDECQTLIEELEESGVFSRDEADTIYSRRMRRDVAKAALDRKNGKQGGNPQLRKLSETPNPPIKPKPNGGVNPPDKAQKPESRDQNPEEVVVVDLAARDPDPPTKSNGVDDDDEILIQKVSKALGPAAPRQVVRAGVPLVKAWLVDGCDLDLDVLPELVDIVRHLTSPLRTMNAPRWADQVRARRDARLAAPEAKPVTRTVFVAIETPQWEAWDAEYKRLKGKSPPTGKDGRGWHFPSEWPPGRAPAADEAVLH
jgi:DNA-binding Lrp family transcriptional regulator